MTKIYLIGFMGSGKSYMGKGLAQLLGWEFLDMDEFLEANEGQTISQIFEEGGETLFRALEKNYLHATYDFDKTIIATGGGAPCFFDNLAWMNTHGTTIYLDTPIPILVKRLKKETAHRPLLANKTAEQLASFIAQKLEARNPFYQKADHIFQYQSGLETPEDLLAELNPSLIIQF
ncbi:MAG: shikimate kinase [Bacteroidota bacterium]